jgi:hypothetical protein
MLIYFRSEENSVLKLRTVIEQSTIHISKERSSHGISMQLG